MIAYRDYQFWGLLMECRTIEDQPKRNRCYENVHRRFPFGKSRDESMNSPQEENDNPIPR